MKRITHYELIEHLKTQPKKYSAKLNDIRNIGNPQLALAEAEAYTSSTGGIIIYQKMRHGGISYYIDDLTEDDYVFLKALVNDRISKTNYCAIASSTREALANKTFHDLFGRTEIEYSYQYGLFQEPNSINFSNQWVIRKLTAHDSHHIADVQQPVNRYTLSLSDIFRHFISKSDPNNIVYGCFINNRMVAYLYVNTFDQQYWDIGYVFTNETSRNRGIATELVSYYAKEIWNKGVFASYGTAINDNSKRVAEKVGFEKFDERYYTVLKEQLL